MKKSLIALTFAAVAIAAQAQETNTFLLGKPVVTIGYERSEVNGVGAPTINQGVLALQHDTVLGKFDMTASVERTSQGGDANNGKIFELGHTTEGSVSGFQLKGRAAVGNISGLVPEASAGNTNSTYAKVGLEAGIPVTSNVLGFAGVEFRKAFDNGTVNRLRTTVGAEYALDTQNTIRAAYTHDRLGGGQAIANGFQVAISHKY